ncbi:MAG TPA: hypothetical protein VHF08_06920, partial [Nitrososphaeraceae archaeon]|nr:hypothetical protein [Nitrososphaeraceae archaeon]
MGRNKMIYATELPELSMSGVVTKSDIVLSPTFESNFTHNPWAANLCDNSSQTTRPIESSVQSPKYVKISSQQSSSALRYQMRDLYNRRKRLADWIKRVNEDVDEPDRTDILKLIEQMQDKERAVLWIVRCITALITLRTQL